MKEDPDFSFMYYLFVVFFYLFIIIIIMITVTNSNCGGWVVVYMLVAGLQMEYHLNLSALLHVSLHATDTHHDFPIFVSSVGAKQIPLVFCQRHVE